MTKKQTIMLVRILIAAAMMIALNFLALPMGLSTALYMAAYLIIGYDILRKAVKGILNGQVFDENFLMAVATIGAIALAIYEKSGDYNEAIAVMLFYQIGELFQSYAVGKSRKSISALMDIRPDYANVERDGQKGFIVGRGGSNIKRIGTEARKEIRQIFPGATVRLDLQVKTAEKWRQNSIVLDKVFRNDRRK